MPWPLVVPAGPPWVVAGPGVGRQFASGQSDLLHSRCLTSLMVEFTCPFMGRLIDYVLSRGMAVYKAPLRGSQSFHTKTTTEG